MADRDELCYELSDAFQDCIDGYFDEDDFDKPEVFLASDGDYWIGCHAEGGNHFWLTPEEAHTVLKHLTGDFEGTLNDFWTFVEELVKDPAR